LRTEAFRVENRRVKLDASPAARALLALELVQNQPGITADAIGNRLGVTARAARRYVAILREAGIPIESVSGPAGGYRPGRGLRPAPMVFTGAEAVGLVMAVLDGHHAAADIDDPVGSALAKILRQLPESVAAQAETVRREASAAPDYAAARPDPATTATLVQASSEGRRARLSYRTESGKELDLLVEPWAVVVRHSRWYLLCHSLTSEAVRTYRVDRVQSATIQVETFDAPTDLDPVSALEEHLASGWDFPVEVRIDAPVERARRFVPRTMGALEPVDDISCRLVGSTSNPTEYAADLANLPYVFRVLGGDELRQSVAALAQRLAAAAR
jgi:predicted DNA-binding transcriptional regulator YafY